MSPADASDKAPKTLYPELSEAVVREWQAIVALLARATGVEAALVMRGNSDSMEVMAASEGDESLYEAGEKAPREGRLYCETVIEEQRPLIVEDAFNDPEWRGNPDTELGLSSYFGLPVNWPDGESFGTICILSKKPRTPSTIDEELMDRLRVLVETTLELLVARSNLEHAATHDGLTGLLDRQTFFRLASEAISKGPEPEQEWWLVRWDVCQFRRINDALGHAVGDTVLQDITERAKSIVRESDLLARMGGEEFAILVQRANPFAVQELKRELADAIGEIAVFLQGKKHSLTLAFGFAAHEPGETLDDWLERVDDLKYRSKHEGRDRESA